MEKVGIIPKPMEMMSASPALFDMQLKRIGYYSKHPALGFALLVHIRYLAAHTLNYSFCQDFNGLVLKKLGLTDDDIRNIEADPENALLEDNEKAMLAFVIKSMKKPDVNEFLKRAGMGRPGHGGRPGPGSQYDRPLHHDAGIWH